MDIQIAEEGAEEMHTIAAAFVQLPEGQLKKVMTDEIIAILAKYGVVIAWHWNKKQDLLSYLGY